MPLGKRGAKLKKRKPLIPLIGNQKTTTNRRTTAESSLDHGTGTDTGYFHSRTEQ